MIFEAKYAGRWVVEKNDKVIASAKTFSAVEKKVKDRRDSKQLIFTLVPKGYMTGFSV